MPVLPTSASEYTHYVGNVAGSLPDPTIKQSTFLYKAEYPSLRSVLVSKYADPSKTVLRDPLFCSPQRPQTQFIEKAPIPPIPPVICSSLTFSPAQDQYGVPYQSFLLVPNNGDFAPGFADFTIQWFQYMDSSLFQPFPRVFSINDEEFSFAWEVNNGTWSAILYLQGGSHNMVTINGSDLLDTWVFVSIVKDSGYYRLFINGVQVGEYYPGGPQSLSDGTTLVIGQKPSNLGVTEGYFGKLTNFHFAVGVVLTSVPTEVITPLPGTKLLLDVIDFDTRFVDSGPLNKPITPFGVGWIDTNPFV